MQPREVQQVLLGHTVLQDDTPMGLVGWLLVQHSFPNLATPLPLSPVCRQSPFSAVPGSLCWQPEPDSARPAEPGRRPHSTHRGEDTTQRGGGAVQGAGPDWAESVEGRGGTTARLAPRAAGKLRLLLVLLRLLSQLSVAHSEKPSSLGPVFPSSVHPEAGAPVSPPA